MSIRRCGCGCDCAAELDDSFHGMICHKCSLGNHVGDEISKLVPYTDNVKVLKENYAYRLGVSVNHLESVFASSSIKDEVYIVAVNKEEFSVMSAARLKAGKIFLNKDKALAKCKELNLLMEDLHLDDIYTCSVYKVNLEVVEKVG